MKNRRYKTKYPRRNKRYKHSKSKWGTFFKRFFAVLGVLIGAAVAAVAVMFVLEVYFKIDTPLRPDGFLGKFANRFNTTLVESPTPYITPEPTSTPYPMNDFSPEDSERELVFPAEFSYSFLGDPYCYGGKVICSAGKLADGTVKLYRLVEFDLENGSVRELPIEPQNDHLLYPVFNDNWLVYFDANYSIGGGNICALDLSSPYSKPYIIKEVYIGQPRIRLQDNFIAWTERTGSDRDKVFACDLSTQETTVVQIYNKSGYGTSMPAFGGGKLIWAAGADANTSLIRSIDMNAYEIVDYKPGTYVHDPEYNGQYFAWLDSPHASGAKLYAWNGTGEPAVVAEDVVEFSLSDKFIAYGKDNAVCIYIFDTALTFCVTPERETAQFLGSSGGAVLWMDVTSRERDIIKYAFPPVS